MDTHNFNLKNSLPGRVSKSVKHLLNEFKNIYEEKLKRLEGEIQSGSQEESLRMKVRILHSYVNDLSDQNQVLVQTVEELEKEATKKVAILEVKLRAADKTIHDLGHERWCLEEDNRHLKAELQKLKTDTLTLAQVTGLTSQRVPLERITDHSAYRAQSSQKPGDLMKAQVEDLRNQLKAKNGIIQSLREEIKTLLFHSAQKKNELLEKKEAMLLLPKPEFEAAQITSGDVIGDRHTKLGLSHQDAAASVGEGREAVEVMAEVESPKEKRAHKLCKQSLKRERIVGRVLNSQRQNKVEVSKLTSQIEHLQLHQGKAKNSSTHSMSQLREQEDSVQRFKPDTASLQACMRRTPSVKEQQLVKEPDHTLQSLQNQLRTSEEKVNSLGLEVGLLRSKLQEKTEQSQQLRDQILKQQEALSRASATLKDTRRAAGNKIHKRENKLSVAQKQLQEAKKQLADCKKEKQKELEKLQEENVGLTGQLKEHSQELHRLSGEKRKVELELAIVAEKHRTTQEEVAGQGQVILQLKTELRVSEEKLHGAQKELVLQEAEVSSLNERLRRQQGRLQELSEMCHQGDAQLDLKERDRQQLQSQVHLAQQQLKRQAERTERLEGELAAARQGHAADTERWSHRNLLLQKELQQVQEQSRIIPKLRDTLNESQHALQLSQEKVTEYEDLVKKYDDEMRLVKQQLEEVQQELRESRTSVQSHQSKADIFKQKYMTAIEKVQQLQAQIQRLEIDAQLSSKQVEDAHAEVSTLRDEMSSLGCRYKKKVSQMEHWEEAVEQLTEELQAALDSLRTREERGLWCEKEMERLRVKVDDQQKQISCYDLMSQQADHSRSSEEYVSLQKQLNLCQKALQQREEEAVQAKAELQQTLLTLCSRGEEVQELREEVQRMLEEKKQKEEENQAVMNLLRLLDQQLQQLFVLYTDPGQEKRAVLSSSLRTTEEQLSESPEQRWKQSSYQLTQLQGRLQKLQAVASVSQKSLQNALQDAAEQHRLSCEAVAERDEAREQMRQQEALVYKLRGMLEQEHGRDKEHQLSKLKLHVADMYRELDNLRIATEYKSEAALVKSYKERALEQSQQPQQDQREGQESLEEQHTLLKREHATLQEKYEHSFREVKSYKERALEQSQQPQQDQREGQESLEEQHTLLKREHATLQEKYEHSVRELQQMSLTLKEALTDNTHLQQERMQLVTVISHWIRQHKAASESLAGRIKEQNRLLAAISREKEHLQECRDSSEEELRRLRILVEEREREIQQLKTVHSHSANQEALVNQLQGHLKVKENTHENPSKIEETQSRLRSNMEFVELLKQQDASSTPAFLEGKKERGFISQIQRVRQIYKQEPVWRCPGLLQATVRATDNTTVSAGFIGWGTAGNVRFALTVRSIAPLGPGLDCWPPER